MTPKKTSLHAEHLRANAKMVEFAGWEMPVTYRGLNEEHHAVRKDCGIFDVSHMGEIFVRGPNSLAALEWLATNQVSKLAAGDAQYAFLLNINGGVVDDIIIYCLVPKQEYLVCVNASNADRDFAWMTEHNPHQAEITNESAEWSQIAIQGPKSFHVLEKIFSKNFSARKTFHIWTEIWQGSELYVATTGYTGEVGCEIFLKNEIAPAFWQTLLEVGEPSGLQPIGLGARDSLRTEMKYPLHGQEISETLTPHEARLGWAVKMNAKDFLGRAALEKKQAEGKGNTRQLIGFRMIDKGIPRPHYKILDVAGAELGEVTSGTHSPTLAEPIGIGYVPKEFAEVGQELWVEIRGRRAKAVVCATPFYNRPSEV